MNKNELKKILKPLIKECIKEVMFEDGTLSTIIGEVVTGLGTNTIVETKQTFPSKPPMRLESNHEAKQRREKAASRLETSRKKLSESIGRSAFNGVDLFEGTTPVPTQQAGAAGPLSGQDPSDPGVDLSRFGHAANLWKKMVDK